ncbi:MAG: helix-turn-helix domain-containing protein [Brevundimonas sp.]
MTLLDSPVQAPRLAEPLDGLGVRMVFARGEDIYAQDETADLLYRVISGAVRTTRIMSDGRRQIGDFYFSGDMFGLECGPTHRFAAEALTTCEVLVFKPGAALPGRTGDTRIQAALWEATTQELERSREHLMLLGRHTALERVGVFLLSLSRRMGRGELAMGRQDMADYLGLTIETVSRMLSQLQAEGVVEFFGARRYRLLRPERLRAWADA